MIVAVGVLERWAARQITAVIRPHNIKKTGPGVCLVIVAHPANAQGVAADFRKRWRIAYRKTGGECYYWAGDAANATVVFKQIVTGRVFLAAVIENA